MFVVPHLMVGGAERHASTLLASMDPARFRGSIVCLQDRGHMGANWDRIEAADVPRVELHRSRRDYLGMLTGLVREMRREKPDIVYVRGFNAEILGRAAGILTGVPRLLIWVRNCGDVVPPGPARRWLNRRLAKATDALYGVAYGQLPYVTDELGYHADQFRVIYNGIDADWIGADRGEQDVATAREIGVAEGETVIGTLAVMRPEKDHPTLLRAFRQVVDVRTDVKLALVGDGPQRTRIEALIDELGLREHVLLLGHQNDVRRLLRTFDIFALSSRTVEACPNSLLEAMSAEIPAVCTAVGGVPEMIDDGVTGHVVPREDPTAMAAAFLDLLDDPERAREMGRAGRRRVRERFTHERSMSEAQDALEETAGRRRPAERPDPVRVTLVLDIAAHGGAETVLRHTFDQLDPARVVTDVVTLREPGPLAGYFRTAGIPFTWLERRGRFDLSTLPRLVGHLRRRGTDVVLSPNYHKAALMLGRAAALLSRRPGGRGATSVVAAHNMDRTVVGTRVLEKYVVNTMFAAGGLQLISPRQSRYLREEEGFARSWASRTREFVVPNGIPMPELPTAAERAEVRAELGVGDEHLVVGIVARLTPAKAHHVLFDAVAGLDDPRLRVVVVGDGQRRAELEEIVARRGLGEQIVFLGQRRDAERLLAGFDVFALSSEHEGVPLSIMEAMARGLPVVSTDVGAVADLVTDGEEGYLVARGDAAAIGARLRKIADDPDLRAALGERALARARREFTIGNTAAAFTAMVEHLAPRRVAGKRRPRR